MVLPEDYKPFNIVEVRFKGSKKLFFKNVNNLDLFTGDKVITDSDIGYDIGEVSLSGELVKLQLKKYGIDENSSEMRTIRSVANDYQIKQYEEYKNKEKKDLEEARTIALQLKLKMKISDIEYQGDGKKVTFYYTSEGRVDFRELIRRYASAFKCRIQMLQVSYREEASRLGGIGSCGRELCCSTWLTDYKVVSMGAAKTQNLAINMLKLSGQCGRLKCCLNYELELYSEKLKQFPSEKVKLKTQAGLASLRKIDILKGTAWYCYENSFDWIPIDIERVNEILAENKKGKTPMTLSDTAKGAEVAFETLEFKDDLLGDTDLTRMDNKSKKSKGRGGSNRPRNQRDGNRQKRPRIKSGNKKNDRKDVDDRQKNSNLQNKRHRLNLKKNNNPNRRNKPKGDSNPKDKKEDSRG